ncbi:leucyl aminopeptidase family protein [Psychromarinibacter sp. C21-152]|uniref:Leucyl aminopeptidase family protein n=1 Tax=Psychromarinibacter sediminicola TaxID=3033385 RepID=A0AAE3NPL5_9RHOB|nr:leucyl aminopeptidase family protein [Psychromarinibacter sediminicola]MDF0599339.1 leucyl aminopeptidase family protein [Psychromarinibacter sediminicola]
MSLTFAPATDAAIPLYVVPADGRDAWLDSQPERVRIWAEANGFDASLGKVLTVPSETGALALAAVGYGDAAARARTRFALARAQAALPEATYRLAGDLTAEDRDEAALGWLLSRYRFGRYKGEGSPGAALIAPDGVDAARLEAIAAGEAFTRDLINTPAADMGPDALEEAIRDLAGDFGAEVQAIVGDELLDANFPMIHAVGRAASAQPRLIELLWGDSGPTLTLVGKGVCFDTGGLNIKSGASMGLMKKDMGGAATVLGLAQTIMQLKLPLQLRVLIPAVENAISGAAFRPQDILTSRKGLTVEINNTDAEGRLVLADALALADEAPPDLLISMATLTGAARVAVGPDIAPFYATEPALADAIRAGAETVADPVWQLPYHAPYEEMIEPGIADLDNAPKGGFAGSITAALFLRRFVTETPRYAHFDIYGWQPAPAPARPKGGVGQGARAILQALPGLLEL